MSSVFINIPDSGSKHWKSPVATAGNLPLTGNQLGDVRLVEDTLGVFAWNGTIWVLIAGPTGALGIVSLNGQTGSSQTFATSESGTNFTITSAGNIHTFNLPVASASNTGKLSSADWTTFNNKQNALTLPLSVANGGTGSSSFTAGSVIFSNGTILTQDNTNFFWDDSGNKLGIGTNSPSKELTISGTGVDGSTAIGDVLIIGSGIVGSGITLQSTNTGGKSITLFSGGPSSLSGPGEFGIFNATDSSYMAVLNPTLYTTLSLFGTSSNDLGTGIDFQSANGTIRNYTIVSTGSGSGAGAGRLAFFDKTASQYRMVIDASGNVGIATTSPTGLLTVNGTVGTAQMLTYSAPIQSSFTSDIITGWIDVSQNFFGTVNTADAGHNAAFTGALEDNGTSDRIYGTLGIVENTSSASRVGAWGLGGDAYNGSTGSISTIAGVYGVAGNLSTGTVTDMISIIGYGNINSGGGTVTNSYGLRLFPQTVGANNYQIYSDGTAPSYFAGKLGMGVSNPSAKIEIQQSIDTNLGGFRTINSAGGSSGRLYVDGSVPGTFRIDNGSSATGIISLNGSGIGIVGINTTTPGAGLDVASVGTASAIIVPRDTTSNRPTSLVNGMQRYNTTTNLFEFYQNGSWVNFGSSIVSLTNSHIFVGNASNVATDVGVSGDLTLANTGAFTIANNVVSNAKLAQMTAHTVKGNNTGSTANASDLGLSSVAETGSSVLTILNASNTIVGNTNLTIQVSQSTTSTSGYLSSTDWNTFNGKQTATLTNSHILVGNGSNIATDVAVSGDLTLANTGAFTFNTVNSNVGSFGSSTSIPSFTVNAKGLITAASGNVVIAPAGTLTGTTLASNVVTSSLTSLGVQSQALNMGSNLINSVTNPVSAQDAATKSYVDAAIAALNPATSVYAATTTNIPGTYLNGVSGIGATFTTTATGTFTVDGVTPPLGSRILIKDQSSGFQNGIYNLTTAGSIGISAIFTRTLDYNTAQDMNNAGLIPVINGTVNALSSWQQVAVITTVGTDSLVFQEFTANPSLYLLKSNNLSDVASKVTSFNNLSPMTTNGDIIYGGASGTGSRLGVGSTGDVLTVSGGIPSWAAPATSGTVTSVALTAPSSILSVSGSPVTSSGTLALSLINQSANQVFAGPTSGGAAAPTFRALVNTDIPTAALTSAHIFVGNGSNLAVDVAVSGDLTLANTGAFTIAVGAVTDTKGSLANKPACAVVSVSNLTLSGEQTIDGVLTSTSLVLLTTQSTGSQNGPWISNSGAWTRPTWYPSGGTTQAFQFITVLIRLGTTYQGSIWRMTSSGAITIDTTSTTWVVTPHAINSNTINGIVPIANGGTGQITAAAAFNALNPMTTTGDIIYESGTNVASRLAVGSTGNVLTVAGGVPTWAAPATSGTVTSVAMTVPSILSVSGSPITSSGTLAVTLTNESANLVFAGPSSGAATTPTFRSLVAADILPINLASTSNGGITGTLPIANGGTGQTSANAAFNALSPMTTGGDIIYGGASGVATRLANGTVGQVLTSGGTTAAPTWTTVGGSGTVTSVAMTVPSFLSISGSPITTSGTLAVTLSGTALPVANGGSGTTTAFTQGSVVFAGASGTYSQDNAQFFWDDTNHFLGIGTASPNTNLDVRGFIEWNGTSRVSSAFSKTSDTSLAAITGLSATLVAGKSYAFTILLYIAGSAGGTKVDLNGGTATATAINGDSYVMDTKTIPVQTNITALNTVICQATTVTGGTGYITGLITVNSGGTFIPRFAQNSSSGTPSTVKVGSTMIIQQIN